MRRLTGISNVANLFFLFFLGQNTTLRPMMPSASQSSQQSFTMSQQSQPGRTASFNRGYSGTVEGPQIYSVCDAPANAPPALSRRSSFRTIGKPLTD